MTRAAKSGSHTVRVKPQYNGDRDKIENVVGSVALPFTTTLYPCLIATRMQFPKRELKVQCTEKLTFLTTFNS